MELASRAHLTHVALTDHDTLDGVLSAHQAAAERGIEFIPGIELSVNHDSTKIHMLVYFLEPADGPLQDRLSQLRAGRDIRNIAIVERLGELGYEITIDDVLKQAAGPSVGRPHIADALVAKGYLESRSEAFDDLLRDGGQAYVARASLTALEAIELSRQSNAVPVIAHPVTMGLNREKYGTVFRDLTDAGLGGIEVFHPMHPPELVGRLLAITASLGLAATGGSDFHGTSKRDYQIGQTHEGRSVPRSAVEQLIEQRS